MKLKNLLMKAVLLMLTLSVSAGGFFYTSAADDGQHGTPVYALADAATGQMLFSENAELPVTVGTLGKLMTVLLCAESIERGELSEETEITVSPQANAEKGAKIWLMPGERITVRELLLGILVGNANDASVAVAETVGRTVADFVELMNTRASELGMSGTVFLNPTGVDCDGQYSTAADMSVLCCELLKHELLSKYTSTWRCFVRNGQTELVNTNNLIRTFEGAMGLKASLTEKSGNSTALAVKRGDRVLVAVCLNFADKDECELKAKNLIKSGFAAYTASYPLGAALELREIEVRGGCTAKLSVSAELSLLSIAKKDASGLSAKAALPKWVEAPIKIGDIVGSLGIYAGDSLLCELPVYAAEDIPERDYLFALKKYLGVLI